MKKAYVTPVMESEAFVANEYVAACWRIVCEKGKEEIIVTNEPLPNLFDDDDFLKIGEKWYYFGSGFTHNPEVQGFIFGVPFAHEVEVIEKSKGNGPHAS